MSSGEIVMDGTIDETLEAYRSDSDAPASGTA
jgi:hypothetical protein